METTYYVFQTRKRGFSKEYPHMQSIWQIPNGALETHQRNGLVSLLPYPCRRLSHQILSQTLLIFLLDCISAQLSCNDKQSEGTKNFWQQGDNNGINLVRKWVGIHFSSIITTKQHQPSFFLSLFPYRHPNLAKSFMGTWKIKRFADANDAIINIIFVSSLLQHFHDHCFIPWLQSILASWWTTLTCVSFIKTPTLTQSNLLLVMHEQTKEI